MTVLADGCSAAQDSAHVDHGSFADDCADVDDRTHHDHGIITDLNLVANECARFDTSFDILHIQKRDSRISTVVFYHEVFDLVRIFCEDRLHHSPVAEDDLVPVSKYLASCKINRFLFLDVNLYRRLFFSISNEFYNFSCFHVAYVLSFVFCRRPQRGGSA